MEKLTSNKRVAVSQRKLRLSLKDIARPDEKWGCEGRPQAVEGKKVYR